MANQVNFGVKNGAAILKIDARDGSFKFRNSAGEDIAFKTARLAMHLASIECGWAQFRKGEGVVLKGTADDESPGEDWKLVVKLQVEGFDEVPDLGGPIGAAEICSGSSVVRSAFSDLHKSFLALEQAHPGETPIVEILGWRAIKTRSGTAYSPVMRIVGWRAKGNEAAETGDLEELLA